MRVFDILKMVRVNHGEIPMDDLTMTDVEGKPNSILTDLLHDVLTKTQLFVNLDEVTEPADIIDILHNVTPLRDDVLEEYGKILTQEISGINFAPQKQQIELVYDEPVGGVGAS